MKESLTPYKMCLNKESYDSKEEARIQMHSWIHSRDYVVQKSSTLKPYKCAFCSKWHVGNSKRR